MVSQNLLFTGNGKITSDPFSPIPPVNRARIDAFTLGDKAEEALLIGMFIEQAEENLTLLTLYMQENREAQWRQRAHRFMGLAGSMGAVPLYDLCKNAEQQGINGDILEKIQAETLRVAAFLTEG